MLIQVDLYGYILGYATIGGDDSWIQYNGSVPDRFEDSCWMFKLVDGELTELTKQEKIDILECDRFKLSDEQIKEILGDE